MSAEHVRIGEVGRRVGVSTSLLRKMERESAIPPPARTATGYRAYREDDIPKIKRAVRERLGKGR